MRRLFVYILMLCFTLNITCLSVLAASKEEMVKAALDGSKPLDERKDMERLLKLVKMKLNIPAHYEEFNSYKELSGTKNCWRFRWSSGSYSMDKNGGAVDVLVDDKGRILNFNRYKYVRESEYQRKLPKVSVVQAVYNSKKFIAHMIPEILGELAFDQGERDYTIEIDGSYRFYFHRVVKNIPVYENGISINVNGQTGEIAYYMCNWTENIVFPDPQKAISLAAAKNAYKKNIGLSLKYRSRQGDGKSKTYLEYSPVNVKENDFIEALSGKKVSIANGLGGGNPFTLDIRYQYDPHMVKIRRETRRNLISQDEVSELIKKESLLSVQSAEKLAKGISELGVDSAYRQECYYYYKQDNSDHKYILRVDFVKTGSNSELKSIMPEEKLKAMMASGEVDSRVSITFNAKTYEVLELSSNVRNSEKQKKTKLDREALKKAAEKFLNKYKAQKAKETVLIENQAQTDDFFMRFGEGIPEPGTAFMFIRKVNGIPFEENKIIMAVDPSTGKLSKYYEIWDSIDFVPSSGILSLDKAYEVLFDNIGMELRYTIQEPGVVQEKVNSKGTEPQNMGVKLIYAPSVKKPHSIDAKKGILLYPMDGKPFVEPGTSCFKDIGEYAGKEMVLALEKLGILFASENFKPEEKVLQKEFLFLLVGIKNSFSIGELTGDFSQEELDRIYPVLLNEDVLAEEERSPDAALTKENAVRYILKSAGYSRLAEMKGIFKSGFKDEAEINPELIGYAAIAKYMNMVNGDLFEPKKEISRGEAVELVYNYLKR